ncbi:peptidylprolyl isomerase [Pseudolabrys sp. FHR47]|uniref:peptidylprolyl isomerase n=1 Tax=Pseudolabrys sp. FHR47 TaxID=2562284 RepID=UPI0010BE9DEE|nr:peptidylprolyl isomerase [Pseudolabrys sp. FHR47]
MTIPTLAGVPAIAQTLAPTVPRQAHLIARLFAGALVLTLAATAPLAAQDAKDPVVATVNGTPITQSDLAVAEEEAGQLPPMSDSAKKDYLVQFMADAILITKAAEDKKLADDAAFKRKLEFARQKLLMEALLNQVAKDASTDAAMRAVYDDAVTKIPAEEEVKAAHILIRATAGDEKASKAAEDKIKAVIARLNKGEDFAKVAGEVTEDPSGKANGGDLGYFTKEQMVPEFANVAFSLDKGKISAPVKTQFGWHVIKVEDKRVKPKPSFEDVKPQVEQFVARKAQAEFVTKLRAEAKIEKNYKVEEPKADAPSAPAEKK